MYILHPKWLVKKGVIQPKTEIALETNFSRPGFRYRIQKEETLWIVAPDRLAVESMSPSMNCGEVIARVLQELPETPLIAMGSNSVYKAPLDEVGALPDYIQEFPRNESLNDDGTVIQRTFHVGVNEREHQVTNVQLAIEQESLELAVNSHMQLDRFEDLEMQHQEAIDAGKRFFEDRESSENLAHHFFGVIIQHD